MTEIEELCQRVAIVDHGSIIAKGTIDALKQELGQDQIIKIEGIIPPAALAAIKQQPGVLNVAISESNHLTQLAVFVEDIRQTLPILMQHLLKHQAILEHISPATVTLEDVFMAKTGRTLDEDTR
jgi:ABC-2 type transport system ATP-binding protein